MISYLHYLLVYGGVGMFGEHEGHKYAKYTGHGGSIAFNNEVTLFDIERSKWIWQKIAGEPPEPCSQSSLTYIGKDKAILLGGLHCARTPPAKDSRPEFIDKAMILDLQSWTWIKLPCEKLCPELCYGHCTVSLHEVLARGDPSVLLLCGETTKNEFQKHIWHLEIQGNKGIWKKVMPAQKNVDLNSFLSYKSTADIVRTSPSTCKLIKYGGHVMGNNSSSLSIIEMKCSGKKLYITRIRDRITGPATSSFAVDPPAKAAQPEELITKTQESAQNGEEMPVDDVTITPHHPEVVTEDRSDPVTESLQPFSMFIRHSDYPNLTFYDLVEHAEIRSTSNEQTINLINNLGLSIFLPPNALPQDQKAVCLRIIPVSGGRLEVPSNYELHTPLYMLTPCELDREAVIKVTHTSLIEDEEDKSNMVILIPEEMAQADSSITYTLKEADVERRFEAGSQTGEIVVKNLQSFQVAKRVTPTMDGQMPVKKTLYTARMYKENLGSCIQKDTLVFSALQLHPVYLQCLKNLMANKYGHLKHEVKFDVLKIPHDAHQVSLSFPTPESLNGWGVEFLKPMITREEIDLPDHADITGLDYPPIIELEVVNDDPYPSHHHTECPVQIVGFCRNDLIIDLTLRIKTQTNSSIILMRLNWHAWESSTALWLSGQPTLTRTWKRTGK